MTEELPESDECRRVLRIAREYTSLHPHISTLTVDEEWGEISCSVVDLTRSPNDTPPATFLVPTGTSKEVLFGWFDDIAGLTTIPEADPNDEWDWVNPS